MILGRVLAVAGKHALRILSWGRFEPARSLRFRMSDGADLAVGDAGIAVLRPGAQTERFLDDYEASFGMQRRFGSEHGDQPDTPDDGPGL